MKKILTVAVPAYNAEKYLKDNLESFCIDGILPYLDILVINDGSSDHTDAIAQEYVERYPDSYRMITKENGGHGSGINLGIREARGIYFKVVDADDWVERIAFCRLIETLKEQTEKAAAGTEESADIVYSGFLWAYDHGEPDKSMYQTKAEISEPFKDVAYRKIYTFDDIADQLYIKMHSLTIKTEILQKHKIAVDEKCYYVDTEYITYPIPYIKTIYFIDAFVYYYRIGHAGQSVGIEKLQKNEKDYDKVIRSLLDFYEKLGKEIPCSEPKKSYIAGIIARAVAGKYKIMLSVPASQEVKIKMVEFDRQLKLHHPDIYRANINPAVRLMRATGYTTYGIAGALVKKKYQE